MTRVGRVGWDGSNHLFLPHHLEPPRPVPLVHGTKLVPAPPHPVCSDGFQLHPHIQALLEPAVGTPLPLTLIDVTVPIGNTCVHFLVLHCPLEEPFTRLTGEEAVVVSGDLVPAHGTQLIDPYPLLRVWGFGVVMQV